MHVQLVKGPGDSVKSSGPVARKSSSPGASTDGLVLQTGEDSAPQGPTTPLGFSPAATYQAQKPKSRVTKTGLKASGKDNFTLNYI